MKKNFSIKKFIILGAVCFLFFGFEAVSAAEIKLEAKPVEIGLNQDIIVDLILKSREENINAISGVVTFPPNQLELKQVRAGNSIVNLWVENPQVIAPGEISFAGITPGGYVGDAGPIFSLVFKAKQVGDNQIGLKNPTVLINDGLGTAAQVQVLPANFRIGAQAMAAVSVPSDENPPEEFKPLLSRDPAFLDNQWFLVFLTQDKGSGISHYQTCEGLWGKCETATSPYLVKNQKINSAFKVKAVDLSGNERVAWLFTFQAKIRYALFALGFIIILVITSVFAKRKRLWRV